MNCQILLYSIIGAVLPSLCREDANANKSIVDFKKKLELQAIAVKFAIKVCVIVVSVQR